MLTINLMEILIIILGIAGFVVLVFFALVLKNLLSLTNEAKNLMEKKKSEIDHVINEIPVLMNNVNEISYKVSLLVDDVNEVVIRSKDDVAGIVSSINSSMADVNRITNTATGLATKVEYTADNAVNTVEYFTNNLLDASRFLTTNKENIVDYIYIFRDFLEEIRRIFFGRK